MKLHLAQIPEAGLRHSLRLELAALPRLREQIGEQRGALEADLLIKDRDGNVEIVGRLRATLHPPCQRCLEPVAHQIDEELLIALLPERAYNDAPADATLGQGDLEVSFYAGEELDLAQILEDELLLLVPEPVAEEDDHERCVVCGKHVDEMLPEEPDDAADHPFAQLKRFLPTD